MRIASTILSIIFGWARFLLVTLPRLVLGFALFLLSIVSRRVGALGSFVLFRVLTYLPVRLMLSPESARLLRDDFMTVMDGAAEALIERHFGQGHTQELVSRDLAKGLERGEFVKPEKYDVGEFGVGLLLTFAALGLVYFQTPTGLTQALSLWIAVATFVLLFSVSTRTLLIDLLAYEEPSRGSLLENTKRMAWNGAFLSDLYPLTTLLLLKSTKGPHPDLYRITAYSFGVGFERAVKEDRKLLGPFTEAFLPAFLIIMKGEELPDEIPSAEEFVFLSQ